MKHKYLTLVALVVVATAMTGAGLVSAGHDPVNPDDAYIHEIQGSIQQGQGAQICIEDMGEDLNKITVEGRTTHTDTTIYHDGADGDVVLEIPELTTPPGHKIVVYSNGENEFINSLQGQCTQGGENVQGPLILGTYYLVTGQIELTRGVTIETGPNRADDAPAPGSGNPSVGLGAGVPSDDTTLGANEPNPDDTDAPDVGHTQPLYGSPENLADDDSDSEGTVDDTTEDAETVVEQVQRAVEDAIANLEDDGSSTDVSTNTSTNTTNTTNTSDASADATGTDGGNVGAGAVGLTGFLGLLGVLFALIRDRSH